MVKIQISSDKNMGKVTTMVLPAKRNSDKTTTKKSNKSALTTESKSYIKKAKSIYWGTPLNIYIPLMKAGYYDPCPAFATFDGLAIDWVKKQKLFVNPPFGKAMDAFCRKSMETYCRYIYSRSRTAEPHVIPPPTVAAFTPFKYPAENMSFTSLHAVPSMLTILMSDPDFPLKIMSDNLIFLDFLSE